MDSSRLIDRSIEILDEPFSLSIGNNNNNNNNKGAIASPWGGMCLLKTRSFLLVVLFLSGLTIYLPFYPFIYRSEIPNRHLHESSSSMKCLHCINVLYDLAGLDVFSVPSFPSHLFNTVPLVVATLTLIVADSTLRP